MPKIYLDSCIVIYSIQAPDPDRTVIRQYIRGHRSPSPLEVYVSPLTRLECRVWPIREGDNSLLDDYDRFFANRELRWARFTHSVFDMATDIRASHGLKTPDALHLAAALDRGCDEIWTNDQRWPARLSARIDVRILP